MSHLASRSRRPDLPALSEQLRRRARRVTAPRQAILAVLRRHARPMTIREVFAELTAGDCDLATVYRSMHLLESLGLVKRFDLGPGGARFELLADGDDGHHHHLVCTGCRVIVELEECFPPDLETRIAARNGFARVTHHLEFYGLCPRCQQRGR
jgi:Fur family ferric uptake transcriptional regulator